MTLAQFRQSSDVLDLRLMNIEYEDSYNGPIVHLFGRDAKQNYHHIEVTDHLPSFFILEQEYSPRVENYSSVSYTEAGYSDIHGRSCRRVYATKPSAVKSLRENFKTTFEADVWFKNRFLIDKGIYTGVRIDLSKRTGKHAKGDARVPTSAVSSGMPPEVMPKVMTVDIEVASDDGFPKPSKAEWPVISIVAHDSYSGEYMAWVLRSDEWDEPDLDARVFDDESVMLNDFNYWLSDQRPDVLTGWFSNNFDYPYLINRCKNLSVTSTAAWSPLGDVWVTRRWKEPAVKGVTCFDMVEGYDKLQIHKLQSKKLATIAGKETDLEKLDMGDFKTVWQEEPERFLDYNRRDVEAVVKIEENVDIMEIFMHFREVTGATLDATPTRNYDMIDMLTLHKAKDAGVVLPTSTKPDEDWYFGAYVFTPRAGLHEHVVYPDLSSLYPNMMAQLNMSPETIVGTRTDLFMSEYSEKDCYWSYVDIRPVKRVESGADYSQYKDGSYKAIMRRKDGGWKKVWAADPKPVKLYYLKPEIQQGFVSSMVDDLLTMKADYKAPDVPQAMYEAVKRVVNSVYGVFGDSSTFGRGFRLFDWRMAESITLGGQFVVKESANTFVDTLNEMKDMLGLEGEDAYLVGGDTDSVMTAMPFVDSAEQANELAQQAAGRVNSDYDEYIPEMFGVVDHRMFIEVESYSPKCFFMQDPAEEEGIATKKRYVTMITYSDGEPVENPKLNIKGFEAIRSDVAQTTQEAQRELFQTIMTYPPEKAKKLVYDQIRARESTLRDGQRLDTLGINFGMSKKPERYGSEDRRPMPQYRGAKYANKFIYRSEAITDTSDAMYYYVSEVRYPYPRTYKAKTAEDGTPVDAISVLEADDIPDEIDVDIDKMIEKTLKNKLNPILHTLGWDYDEAVQEHKAHHFM